MVSHSIDEHGCSSELCTRVCLIVCLLVRCNTASCTQALYRNATTVLILEASAIIMTTPTLSEDRGPFQHFACRCCHFVCRCCASLILHRKISVFQPCTSRPMSLPRVTHPTVREVTSGRTHSFPIPDLPAVCHRLQGGCCLFLLLSPNASAARRCSSLLTQRNIICTGRKRNRRNPHFLFNYPNPIISW
jgi:hypothetical protein